MQTTLKPEPAPAPVPPPSPASTGAGSATRVLAAVPVNRFILNRTGWVQVASATLLVLIAIGALLAAPADTEPMLGRGVGFLFLALLAAYLYITYRWARRGGEMENHEQPDPEALMSLSMAWLMVVGGLMAAGQQDIKRMFAYSSISQVGFIVLALGLATPTAIVVGRATEPVFPSQGNVTKSFSGSSPSDSSINLRCADPTWWQNVHAMSSGLQPVLLRKSR